MGEWGHCERWVLQVNIEGLTPYTKYVVRVKAYNSAGGGPNTENLEVQTARADAPLPPQDMVVLQEGVDFFVVSWVPPYPPYGPLESYKLRYKKVTFDRGDDWITGEYQKNDPRLQCRSDQPSYRACFNVTGQAPGQQYRVQAAAKIKEGAYGQWCEAIVANTLEILPGAPRSISLISKQDDSLTLRWEAPIEMPERVTQYKLHIKPCELTTGDAKVYTVDGSVTEYQFADLQPETCYNVTIQAGTSRGFGPGRTTQQHTDLFTVPVVGTWPTVSPLGSDTLQVEWPAVVDAKGRVGGYIVEYNAMHGAGWLQSGAIVPHYNVKARYLEKITGLQPNTDYQVRIRVVDKNQRQGEPSDIATARTGCGRPTAPPGNLQLTAPTATDVRVVWAHPPQSTWRCGDISYMMQYRNGTRWTDLPLPGTATEQRFTSRPYTKWTVKIRTVNEAGESEWSEEVSTTTPEDAPGPVGNVNARPTGPTSAVVTWNAPEQPNGEIEGYTIVYRPISRGKCGTTAPGGPVAKHVRSEKLDVTDLEPATTYEVVIKAKTSKEGPPSDPITFTTAEAIPTGED